MTHSPMNKKLKVSINYAAENVQVSLDTASGNGLATLEGSGGPVRGHNPLKLIIFH